MWSKSDSLKGLFNDSRGNEVDIHCQVGSPLVVKDGESPPSANFIVARSFDSAMAENSSPEDPRSKRRRSAGKKKDDKRYLDENDSYRDSNASGQWIEAMTACTGGDIDDFDMEYQQMAPFDEGPTINVNEDKASVEVHPIFSEVCQVLQLQQEHDITISKMKENHESREMFLEDQCQHLCDRLLVMEKKLDSASKETKLSNSFSINGALKLEQRRRASSEKLLTEETSRRQTCEEKLNTLIASQNEKAHALEKERREAEAREKLLEESVQRLEAKIKADAEAREKEEFSNVTPKNKEVDIELQSECQTLRDQINNDRTEFENECKRLRDKYEQHETELDNTCQQLRDQVEKVESECEDLQKKLESERGRHLTTANRLSQEIARRELNEKKSREAKTIKLTETDAIALEQERKRLAETVARLKTQFLQETERRKRSDETIEVLKTQIQELESAALLPSPITQKALPEQKSEVQNHDSNKEEEVVPPPRPSTHFTKELLSRNNDACPPASARSAEASPVSNSSSRDSMTPTVRDSSPVHRRNTLRPPLSKASSASSSEGRPAKEMPSSSQTRDNRMKSELPRRMTRTLSADARNPQNTRYSRYVVGKIGLTRHRMLYHISGCSQLADVHGSDDIKEYPMSVEEIKYMRHRPCPKCKPKNIGVLQNRLLL